MEPLPSAQLVEELLAQRSWLQALARRLAAEGESEDLVQDAWVAALEGPPGKEGTIRPWLAGVMRNLARGLRRTRSRRRARERVSSRPEALPSTLELVERVDTEQRLARALLALDEPYRTTLLLRLHAGLSSAEIARRQDVPEGTVRWRVKTGLAELRARLAKEYGSGEVLGLALARLVSPDGTGIEAGPSGAAGAAGVTTMILTKGLVAGILALSAAVTAWRVAERRLAAPATLASTDSDALQPESIRVEESTAVLPASSGSSQRSPAGGGVTRIRILESDGRPNAELDVALEAAPGETYGPAGTTDADGWVGLPASGDQRTIAVQRVNAFPFRTELELVPGESTIQLPPPGDGALAGAVLVDGQPPPQTLWLTLHVASSAAIGLDVWGPSSLLTKDFAYVSTDAEGRFRFRGLAPGQGVNLRAPEGHARQGMRPYSDPGEAAVVHFEGPAEDLRLELERWPSLRGRVVEADGLTPVVGGWIEMQLEGGRWGRDTGPGGMFEIFLREPAERVCIRYGRSREWHELHGSAQDVTTAERTFDEPSYVTDLGDLLLAPSSGFFLEVRDGAGNVLAGAEVGECTGQPSEPTNATDATGRTWMTGLAPGTELAVTMRGHRTAFVTLPDPIPEVLPLVLAPSNDLALEIRGADGQPLAGVQHELSAPVWFFLCEEPVSEAWRRSFLSHGGPGAWWMSWERNKGFEGRRGSIRGGLPVRVRFSADANGRCSFGELDPAVALHLTVLDDVGAVLHEEELAPLGAEERRVVQVRVSTAVGAVRGRVVSEAGEPISSAQVSLAFGAESSARTSQADGRFQFTRLADHELVLTVERPGFLPRVLERVRPSAEEVEVVLVRGFDLTVLVREASGPPHVGGTVRARKPGEERHHQPIWNLADPVATGLFELAGLPAEPLEIVLDLPAGLLQQTWTPPQREIVFWVPEEVGTVELAPRAPASTFPGGLRAWVERRGGGERRHLALDPTQSALRVAQFAGDYDLVFEQIQTMGDLTLSGNHTRRPFTVRGGETVRIELP